MNTTPTQTPAPPERATRGCLGIGCSAVLGLLLFFALAILGGALWAFFHFRHTYSSTEPIEMPEVILSDSAEPVEASGTSMPNAQTRVVVPIKETEKRWNDFEKAADKHREASIQMTAAEINALLQNGEKTRGKAFVTISGNVARVRVSIPLKDVMLMNGRYLNGEISVEASPDGDPAKARMTNITVNQQPVGEGILDRQMFGMKSIRGAVNEWLSEQDIQTFRIENDRVMGGTRSDR